MNTTKKFKVNVKPSCKQYWNQCDNKGNDICNSSNGHWESLFVLRHWSRINFKYGKLSCPLVTENYCKFFLAMKTSSAAIWNTLITFIRFASLWSQCCTDTCSKAILHDFSKPVLNFPALGGGIDRRFDDFNSPIFRWVFSLTTLFKLVNGLDLRIKNSKNRFSNRRVESCRRWSESGRWHQRLLWVKRR